MQKTILITLLVVLSCATYGGSAKWTQMENWRKIKDNMPEAAVIKTLGKPKFTTVSSGLKVLYYSTREPAVEKGKIVYNEDAEISLYKKHKTRSFYVSRVTEPDFSKVKDAQEEKPKKLKPKRKLEKWEQEKLWKRLKVGMTDKALIHILGEPRRKVDGHSKHYYHYGAEPLGTYITISTSEGDMDNTVISWDEPFWYLLNKELYEEVKPKDKQPIKEKDK